MEFQNFIIFRDWFTLYFRDSTIQSKYINNKYVFIRMMFTLVSYFICFVVLLSINLGMMYNDKTKDVVIGDLVFNAVLAGITLVFMLLLAYWKVKYWTFNMLCSLYMNFTHFIVFESIKMTSFVSNQNPVGIFVITIVEFCTKGIYLFFVDDNFVYNLFCYFAFLPLYLAVFINLYEKQDNEIGFFIIIFTFLAIGIYFIERIFKINYFGNATYDQEIIRNRNLVDNMKSGFVMFNLDDSKVTYNKIMKNKFIPKLLTGVSVPDNNLSIFQKEEELNIDEMDNPNNKDKDKDSTLINKDRSRRDSSLNLMGEPEADQYEIEKQCNIVKNILFTRLERVNAHDFEGELKKASDEVNMKINASTTKTKKYMFFNAKTNKIAKKKVGDEVEDDKQDLNEKSEFGRSEAPIIKDSNFKLLFDNDFENLIAILLSFSKSLKEFKYLGTKRIKQEHDEDFICQIFVRYHDHGRNLEFVLTESNVRKGQITAESLAKGLISKNMPYDKDTLNFIKAGKDTKEKNNNGKLTTAFLNKANTTIKHPLKEISVKMREAIELLENPEENAADLREIMYYADNLAGLATFALEDLKYMNKLKKKQTVEKEKVDLPTLLETVIDLSKARLKFKNKDVKLTFDIGQNVDDTIISDNKKITHILLNLIQNSINASSYGNIHILVESKSKRRDIISFTVFDQGVQMKKEEMDYYNKTLLEDFEKITGLVICKQLVEAIGRDLRLERNGNQGTKASFYVKVHDDEALNEDPQMTTDVSEEEDTVNIDVGKDVPMNTEIAPISKNINFSSIANASTLRKIEEHGLHLNMNMNNLYKRFSHVLRKEIVDNCDMRIICADDDPVLRSTFRKHIESLALERNLKFDIIECKDGADLLYSLYTHFEADKFVDALLFDENMNFITGAVLVEIISILFKRSVIPDISVFMATEYEMSPSQYKFLKHLAKPIDYNSIKKHLSLILDTPK